MTAKTFDENQNIFYLEIVPLFQHLWFLGFGRWEGGGLARLLGRLGQGWWWQLPQHWGSVTLGDRGEGGGRHLDMTQLVRVWINVVVGGGD